LNSGVVAHTVEDDVLERIYDILMGHDFMQLYGIKLLPHKGDIGIDEERLSLAPRIRRVKERRRFEKPMMASTGGFSSDNKVIIMSLIPFTASSILLYYHRFINRIYKLHILYIF
jgi:hypothetical protein